MARTRTTNGSMTGANLGCEVKLWAMADWSGSSGSY